MIYIIMTDFSCIQVQHKMSFINAHVRLFQELAELLIRILDCVYASSSTKIAIPSTQWALV